MPCIDHEHDHDDGNHGGGRRLALRGGLAGALLLAGCGSPPQRGNAEGWALYQLRAAQRLVAANPGRVYTGAVPDPLLAIPVLQIALDRDGGVRDIEVLRTPTQARDTVQLAIDAVRRAAPFGSVAHLPRPWQFAEVFLFDDDRRFKPRTLDI